MLVQRVCLGRVAFGASTPEEATTAAIEFARLADMYHITGEGSFMAEHISRSKSRGLEEAGATHKDSLPHVPAHYFSSRSA